jgi:hypothetical protein
MIIESIIGVVVVGAVVYLYWKSVEKETKESIESLQPAKPVVEKPVDPENLNLVIEVGAVEATSKVVDQKPKRVKKAKSETKPKTTKTATPKAEVVVEKPVKKPRARKPKMTVLK